MDTFEKAKLNPSSVFDTPEEVTASSDFTLEQKVEILRNWAYDANELLVAEEENMGDGEPAMLGRILKELNRLGGGHDSSHSPAHKQGGIAREDVGKK
jgi:hypothetical protein